MRQIIFALLGLFALPAAVSAGPIEFGYATGNITTSPWAPELALALMPFQPPGPGFAFDPASGTPTTLPAVLYQPQMIPKPAPIDIHPGGYTHWNNDGYFGVDVSLTDFASGQSATLHFSGRAHMYSDYSTQTGWSGVTYFWFQDVGHVTLGGNDYTVWGANHFDGSSQASVNVWVGADPPLQLTPEPATFALAALGLAPFGLRAVRRTQKKAD